MSGTVQAIPAPTYRVAMEQNNRRQTFRVQAEPSESAPVTSLTQVLNDGDRMSRFQSTSTQQEKSLGNGLGGVSQGHNPLDTDGNGLVSGFEIQTARQNRIHLTQTAAEQLKKILELQSQMTNPHHRASSGTGGQPAFVHQSLRA
ncbi:MAG: hypothetical protein U0003_03550 [Vampirovibrionales bacterium]